MQFMFRHLGQCDPFCVDVTPSQASGAASWERCPVSVLWERRVLCHGHERVRWRDSALSEGAGGQEGSSSLE